MTKKTLYTAIGCLKSRTNGCGRFCPVILLNDNEYMIDFQELVLWSSLNWRILNFQDIGVLYTKTVQDAGDTVNRSWEACLHQLLLRGIIVSGSGDTEYDALHNLLWSLSITPVDDSFLFRFMLFVKLTLCNHFSGSVARKLLTKQVLLSSVVEKCNAQSKLITLAVTNLYLRKQIIFQKNS